LEIAPFYFLSVIPAEAGIQLLSFRRRPEEAGFPLLRE
jgi:hypothetical protein